MDAEYVKLDYSFGIHLSVWSFFRFEILFKLTHIIIYVMVSLEWIKKNFNILSHHKWFPNKNLRSMTFEILHLHFGWLWNFYK